MRLKKLSISQLAFTLVAVLLALGSLRHCEQKQNIIYLQNQVKQAEAKRIAQASAHTKQLTALEVQNDSLLVNSRLQKQVNYKLLNYGQRLDSALQIQIDSTRRIKQEATYLRKQEQQSRKYVQQMFLVLADGQEHIRSVVDSVRMESRLLADRYYSLSVKLADSSRFAQKTLSIYKDSISIQPSLDTTIRPKRKRNSSSIDQKRRQRQQARRLKKQRRKTLIRG
ncbi:hypothetical protein QNI19_16415 [Cytophagaceae bacterium DM2B3-1]|uniref:Uncharacterized protein n=1 Tax=Xanthocytophaga flava TaxID=3048013 RepID=A0ABT7CLG2_9BACT|nr:hypothetical protein [Xanthocytophaga flavus]MDJ1494530.1 hypothetical protein [Xanthocytophaga flavus]